MAIIVFDADETLWRGIVVEGEVFLKDEVKPLFKELRKRGHEIFLCSKSDEDKIEQTLEGFELELDTIGISWGPKSETFTSWVNIGLLEDFVLFVDDSRFEIDEVRRLHPKVHGLLTPVDLLSILSIPELMVEGTPEEGRRVELIKESLVRKRAEEGYGGDYIDFLAATELKLRIRKAESKDKPRVLNLLNRTNELKASRDRYEDGDIGYFDGTVVGSLKDIYGDYGLITAMLLISADTLFYIYDLAVSCRTVGRGIGTAMVIEVCKRGKPVWGRLEPTGDTWKMKELYSYLGFEDRGAGLWYLEDGSGLEYPPWLEIS